MIRFVITVFMSLCIFCVRAQNSNILKEFNTFFDSQKQMQRELQLQQKQKDSIELAVNRDSVKQGIIIEPEDTTIIFVEQIDTATFVKKVQFPKEQIPKKKLELEKDWKKEFLITNQAQYKTEHELNDEYKVFGWHPFWMGTAYESYNFSLLSMIAYFSYELEPKSGNYKSIHNWKTTALIDSAHAHGSKVLLTVSNFGTKNNHVFLNRLSAQKQLIRNLITLLKERNADGVNIDFEAINDSDKEALNNFLIDLSTSLKSENNDYLVTVAVPAIDFKGLYEIASIHPYIDLFVVMGYEFHGSHSKSAGPIAPLASGNKWMPINLQRSVDEYLVAGVPPKKLILALPYYGVEWQTYDLKFPSKVKHFEGFHTYRYIKNKVGNYNCIVEDDSQSKYYAYRDSKNNYRQIWFEDSTTLGVKYDWVKEKNIGGVGIWALGYDNGYTELWELLGRKFAYTDGELATIKKNTINLSLSRMLNLVSRLIKNPRSVLTHPRPVLILFGGFFGVSVLGILLIIRYGHRLGRLLNITLKGTLSLIIIVAFAIVFVLLKYINIKEVYILIGGIILGLFLFFLFSRRFISQKELP